MGFSFSKLFKKANPLALAQKAIKKSPLYGLQKKAVEESKRGFKDIEREAGNYGEFAYKKFLRPVFGGALRGGWANELYHSTVSDPREAAQERRDLEIRGAANMAQRRSNLATTSVLAQGQGALQDVRGGYGKALSQLDPLRQAELSKLRDQSAIAGAQSQQAAVARGTYNTSLAEDARRGVATETARATADLESRYASIRAGLELGKAESLASVQGQIAAQTAAAGQTSAAINQNRANALANLEYRDPREYLNQLLGIAGAVGGIAYGSSRNYPNTPGV